MSFASVESSHTIRVDSKSINRTHNQLLFRLKMEIRSSVAPWTQKIKRNTICLHTSKKIMRKEIFMHRAVTDSCCQLRDLSNGILVHIDVSTVVSWFQLIQLELSKWELKKIASIYYLFAAISLCLIENNDECIKIVWKLFNWRLRFK